jgi:hypothetical protein
LEGKGNNMWQLMAGYALGMVITIVVFVSTSISNVPIQYYSNTTNKCVKVEYNGYDCGCEFLTKNKIEKFERVWVK